MKFLWWGRKEEKSDEFNEHERMAVRDFLVKNHDDLIAGIKYGPYSVSINGKTIVLGTTEDYDKACRQH